MWRLKKRVRRHVSGETISIVNQASLPSGQDPAEWAMRARGAKRVKPLDQSGCVGTDRARCKGGEGRAGRAHR